MERFLFLSQVIVKNIFYFKNCLLFDDPNQQHQHPRGILVSYQLISFGVSSSASDVTKGQL